MGRALRGLAVVVGLASGSVAGVGSAQLAPAPAPGPQSAASGAAMLTNPMMNPVLNPYLNSSGGYQDPRMARDAAVLFLLQRQAQGGIGSGMLANGRPAPRAATTNRAPTQIPPAVMVPGANASRYFNTGQGSTNQMNDYFSRKARPINSGRR